MQTAGSSAIWISSRTQVPDGLKHSRSLEADPSAELKLINGIVESVQKAVQRCNGQKVRIPLFRTATINDPALIQSIISASLHLQQYSLTYEAAMKVI